MRILVVGNGSTGIKDNSGFFINNHTGNFLKSIGVDYSVCFAQSSTLFDKNNNLQNFDLAAHGVNFELLPKRNSKFFFPKVFALISRSDFLYIFYPGTLGKIMALVAILFKKRIGLYIRGQYYNQSKFDRFILRNSKFILTVSPTIKFDLMRFCKDVEVIKPMIDIEIRDFNLGRVYHKPEVWNLLFVGRVEERKGIYDLINIASYLKLKNLKFVLNIVGGGELYKEIENLISKMDLSGYVNLKGLVSERKELAKLYDSADAFIFTSHDEGFPRVLYEAMASGLPIFTTFVGGISGRMVDSSNCLAIPVGNSEYASNVVFENLSNNCDILEKIGRSGQKTLELMLDGSLLKHEEIFLDKIKFKKKNE